MTQRQNKDRINIRIDADLVEHFKAEAEKTLHSEHPVGYQTLINEALRECINTRSALDRISLRGDLRGPVRSVCGTTQ